MDGTAKMRQLIDRQGQSGCLAMPAVAFQRAGRCVQRRQDVDVAPGTARPAKQGAVSGQHDNRTGVLLRQARGDDPDNTGMPVRTGDHQDTVLVQVRLAVQLSHRFARDGVLDFLALLVEVDQVDGDFACFGLAFRQKQPDRVERVAHAAGGVDARGSRKAEHLRSHLAIRLADRVDQDGQARRRRGRQVIACQPFAAAAG